MRVWLIMSLFAAALGSAVVARAQSDDERARMHFEAGRSYYDQARYDDAAREFQQAYDLSARPEMLLNLSQAHERALRYDEAIQAAQRYLEVAPDAADRKTVEDRIANLQLLKERLEHGPSPLPPPGDSDPGTLREPGEPGPAAPPSSAEQPPTSPTPSAPAAPVAATEPADSTHRFTIPAIVLMSTGGAALVGSLVTGLIAHADYESLQRRCAPDGACPPSAADELDEGETLSVFSTVLTVVGVLAAGTGGALLVLGANEEAESAEARAGRVQLSAGRTPLSLAARVSF